MKYEIAMLLLLLPCVSYAFGNSPRQQLLDQEVPVFFKTWGGGADWGQGVAADSVGNIYVTGSTYSFGDGGSDVLLVKYDQWGHLVWQRTWGSPNLDFGRDLALDSSGDIYIAGQTAIEGSSYDVLLLKFDPLGNILWERIWGSYSMNADDGAKGIAVDSLGDAYVTGYIYSGDGFLLKFNSTGNLEWQKTWGFQDISGWSGRDVSLDQAGNIFVASNAVINSTTGQRAVWLLKFNSTGDLRWQRYWFGDFDAEALTVDKGGAALVAGGYGAFFVIRFANNGDLLWQRTWSNSTDGMSVASDSLGDVYVTGVSFGLGRGLGGLILLKMNSEGDLLWAKVTGEGSFGEGLDAATDPNGRILVTGYTYGPPSYNLTDVNVSLNISNYGSEIPSIPVRDGQFATRSPHGIVTYPVANETYSGDWDMLLLKFGQPDSPGPPINLQAMIHSSTVTLNWNTPSSSGGLPISSYRIYRGNASGDERLLVALPAAAVSYTDSGVIGGRSYYYYVTAVNQAGESIASNEVGATVHIPLTSFPMIQMSILVAVVPIVIKARRRRPLRTPNERW